MPAHLRRFLGALFAISLLICVASTPAEAAVPQCSNGVDDDGDHRIDFYEPVPTRVYRVAASAPPDPGCRSSSDTSEGCPGLDNVPIRGTRSAWWQTDAPLANFGTEKAVCNAAWTPKIDLSFVPQGFALVGDGTAYLSGYRCTAPAPGATCADEHSQSYPERCEIQHVNPLTGRTVTLSRLIPGCRHGGGIATIGGRIWLADTHKLIALDSFDDETPRAIKLEGLNGSFLVEGTAGSLHIGHWREEPRNSTLYKFSAGTLERKLAAGSQQRVLRVTADESDNDDQQGRPRSLPPGAQGADFDSAGRLWVSSSTASEGELIVGSRTREFGPGSEEIEYASDGSLWAVFEAGSRKYPSPFLPLILRFDPGFRGG